MLIVWCGLMSLRVGVYFGYIMYGLVLGLDEILGKCALYSIRFDQLFQQIAMVI